MSEYERERADWSQDKRYFEETVKSLKATQEKHSDTLAEIKNTILRVKTAVVTVAAGISVLVDIAQLIIEAIVK